MNEEKTLDSDVIARLWCSTRMRPSDSSHVQCRREDLIAILQAATRDAPSVLTAEQIYAELKGVAVTRTSPENICDVLAVIKRLQAASKGDGND